MTKRKRVDDEVTPQHKHQEALKNEDKLFKSKNEIKEVFYQIIRDKLIKKTKMASGSVYSSFMGPVKNNTDLIKELNENGQIKIAI